MPQVGFEPTLPAPEADALSPELLGLAAECNKAIIMWDRALSLRRTKPRKRCLSPPPLSQTFGDAFASLGLDSSFGAVVVSARPDLAQFQCNGAMSAAKHAGKNPREVAQAVIDGLEDTTPFCGTGVGRARASSTSP